MIQYLERCVITRFSGGSALRTDSIEGEGIGRSLLSIGMNFILFAESFENPHPEAVRMLRTSAIVDLSLDGHTAVITTESGSIYKIDYLSH